MLAGGEAGLELGAGPLGDADGIDLHDGHGRALSTAAVTAILRARAHGSGRDWGRGNDRGPDFRRSPGLCLWGE
ncbi:hypothetical protein ACFFX0_01890 [Citricoccus parietis]|uniref:Uncharacterized protein n=1 Tax=Citricoccus parietis TaxID=592307 RepID=A0ABV5FTJ3_9MICC